RARLTRAGGPGRRAALFRPVRPCWLTDQPDLHTRTVAVGFAGWIRARGWIGGPWCTKLTRKPESTRILRGPAAARCPCAPGAAPHPSRTEPLRLGHLPEQA